MGSERNLLAMALGPRLAWFAVVHRRFAEVYAIDGMPVAALLVPVAASGVLWDAVLPLLMEGVRNG